MKRYERTLGDRDKTTGGLLCLLMHQTRGTLLNALVCLDPTCSDGGDFGQEL